MKYDLKELNRALERCKGLTCVDLSLDPKERLLLNFVDPHGEIQTEIILYPMKDETSSKFAEIKTVKRL